MDERDDGGPAFPSTEATNTFVRRGTPDGLVQNEAQSGHDGPKGMTLRDYFAAQALAVAYQEVNDAEGEHPSGWGSVVTIAYVIADHMIATRTA